MRQFALAMKILMVSSELAPFSKVGGLADMVASLSKEMANSKNEVKIITPLYSSIKNKDKFEEAMPVLSVHMGLGIEEYCKVWKTSLGKAEVYFLEFNRYFDRPGIYNFGDVSYNDNGARYAFLCRAALDFCVANEWYPDVVHCHDWPTGYIPLYLNNNFRNFKLGRAASVFTIHNMQHQGVFDRGILEYAGLPQSVYNPYNCEHFGVVNLMKGALYNATKVSTVSPTYAKEIQTPQFGCGLDGIVRFKSADIVGVLNGIDIDEWNPEKDKFIPAKFSAAELSGKAECKKALQKKMGLVQDSEVPVFGVVSRLFDQKGLDLLANIGDALMDNMKIQIVLLGSGDRNLENAFNDLAARHPGKMGVYIGYNNELSHLIEAGSDFFLMPSRFEPCGLNQMYSMRYGTLPLVRATGGLSDTVENYSQKDRTGCGFSFMEATPWALYNTIDWAVATWYDRKPDYLLLQQNAMKKDFSWSKSATEYANIYKWAVAERAKGF